MFASVEMRSKYTTIACSLIAVPNRVTRSLTSLFALYPLIAAPSADSLSTSMIVRLPESSGPNYSIAATIARSSTCPICVFLGFHLSIIAFETTFVKQIGFRRHRVMSTPPIRGGRVSFFLASG